MQGSVTKVTSTSSSWPPSQKSETLLKIHEDKMKQNFPSQIDTSESMKRLTLI